MLKKLNIPDSSAGHGTLQVLTTYISEVLINEV